MKIYKLCKPYLSNHKPAIITYLTISVFVGLFSMINPFLIGDFIDSLIEGGSMIVVYRFVIIFAGINIIKTVFSYITMMIYTKTQSKATHEFSQKTITHIQGVSATFVNKRDTDYIAQVVNGDTNQLIIFCISVLHSFILNAIYIIVPLVILLTLNIFVTALLMVLLLMYIFIYIKFREPLFDRSMSLRIVKNSFFAKLLEQLKLTKFIKLHELGSLFRKRMDNGFDELLNETIEMQKLSFFYSSLDTAVTTVVQIVLFLLGGFLILNDNFTIGMFTIFSMYFNMMLGATKYFFKFGQGYQDNLVSYNRLKEIFDTPLETLGGVVLKSIEKIEVKDLVFSYSGTRANIISGLNLEFRKGSIYGIIGHNGSGKSTLINLLTGMYIDERSGEIFFNSISSKELNMSEIRRVSIGVAEQEPVILNESMMYNIEIGGNGDFIDKKENSKLQSYLETLNMDNLTSDSPVNYSGGEKQKLSVLRLLLKDPDVMIFDEPTSEMDTESIEKFAKHLHNIKKNKIIIVITHDNYFKEFCDVCISID